MSVPVDRVLEVVRMWSIRTMQARPNPYHLLLVVIILQDQHLTNARKGKGKGKGGGGNGRIKKKELCPSKILKGTPDWNSIFSPKRMPPRFECQIVIKSGTDKQVEFEINDFQMMQSDGCSMQSMAIYDGTVSESTLATRFCGDAKPHRVTSKGGTVILKISSNLPGAGMAPPVHYEIKYRANMDWDKFKAQEDKPKGKIWWRQIP